MQHYDFHCALHSINYFQDKQRNLENYQIVEFLNTMNAWDKLFSEICLIISNSRHESLGTMSGIFQCQMMIRPKKVQIHWNQFHQITLFCNPLDNFSAHLQMLNVWLEVGVNWQSRIINKWSLLKGFSQMITLKLTSMTMKWLSMMKKKKESSMLEFFSTLNKE